MAAPINLPVNAPANIDTPSTGRYNLFLNSSDSDQLYKKDSSGVSTAVVIASSGTVTSVSVVSANGLAGTVANATTTPAITLSTSINSPVLAGNGTALIAATTTGSGSTVVLNTSPTFVTDISAPKIISSTASGGLLLCNNNGVTVASFGVGSAGSTNIGLIGATAVTGILSATGALTLGVASSAAGSIVLQNATNANTLTIQSGVTSASYSLTLPTAQGGANTFLKNDGTGVLSWAAAGGAGITVGTTTITSGTTLRVPYNNAGVYSELANFTMGSVASGYLDVPSGYAIGGTKALWWSSPLTTGNLSVGSRDINTGVSNVNVGVGTFGAITGSYNTAIGEFVAGDGISGSSNTFVGRWAGRTSGGSSNQIIIGSLANRAGTGANNTLVIGSEDNSSTFNVTMSANDAVIGSNGNSGGYQQFYFGQGKTKVSPSAITFNVTGGSGTNNAGSNFIIAGGKGTGTAAGGTYKSQTSVKGSSGTTLQSLTDRHTVPAKYVDITGGAATTFGQLALATSGTVSGGIVIYVIEANDGTDYQSLSGTLRYDVVNKAGTLTVVYSDTQNGTGACSTGTLTATVTATTSGTNVLFQANAVSSLSETVLRVSFQVLNNFGVATITAA